MYASDRPLPLNYFIGTAAITWIIFVSNEYIMAGSRGKNERQNNK